MNKTGKDSVSRNNASLPLLDPDLERVLIMMTDHHLGNFAIAMPVLDMLASHFTNRVTLLVADGYVSLARRLPSKPHVIPYKPQRHGGFRSASEYALLALQILRTRYRAIIDVSGGIRSVTLAGLSGAPLRLGFAEFRRSWIYSHRTSILPLPHAYDRYSRMLGCMGHEGRAPLITLTAGAAAAKTADDVISAAWPDAGSVTRLAVIHPGAGYAFRCWPQDRFARVADELVGRWGMRVCLIGAPGDKPRLEGVLQHMKHREHAMQFIQPLEVVLALFERASILVSNESGPTHLAALTTLPIVTIFGPSEEECWRPIRDSDMTVLRGAKCDIKCKWGHCDVDLKCLLSLNVERVIDAVDDMLGRSRG